MQVEAVPVSELILLHYAPYWRNPSSWITAEPTILRV